MLQGRDIALADQLVVLIQALEHALNCATKALPVIHSGAKLGHSGACRLHLHPAQHVYEFSLHL